MPCSLTGSVSGVPVTSISNVEKKIKAKWFLRSVAKFLSICMYVYLIEYIVIMHIDGKYFSPTCLYTMIFVEMLK
jgi:hypothetical protein